MTEADIRRDIAQYLLSVPGCLFTLHVKARGKFVSKSWPPANWPDLSGSFLGRGLFIEVKKPDGVATVGQIRFIDEARRQGNIAFFADSVEVVKKGMGL